MSEQVSELARRGVPKITCVVEANPTQFVLLTRSARRRQANGQYRPHSPGGEVRSANGRPYCRHPFARDSG